MLRSRAIRTRTATSAVLRPARSASCLGPAAAATGAVSTGRIVYHHGSGIRQSSSSSSSSRSPQTKDRDHMETAGSFARTDAPVTVEHLADHELLASTSLPGAGRAGANVFPTLATFSLQGKVGVVTGGARGLGLAMGQGMVVSGADLAIVDLSVDEARAQAKAIVDRFQKENPQATRPPKITAHYADVSSEDSVAACVAEILAEHGKIDSLVTSAGFVENLDAVKYPLERMRRLFAVNVDGTYLFATAVGRHLMERGAPGSMVFIGSMSGTIVNVPQPQAPYNSAKAAVRHLAASLAVEWAHAGIRVNCISPGYMLTPLTQKILADKPDLKKRWISLTPQGRMGRPEDLIGPVAFLLSDAAGYVTGADLRVDGGYTLV